MNQLSEKATPRPGSPGRPPDPEIEPRVLDAALSLYARVGWDGFSIDAVARESRVGKAAIYRRWATKEVLIAAAVSALRKRDSESISHNFGESFRDDITVIVNRLAKRYFGKHGLAYLRVQLEAKAYPDVLGEAMESLRSDAISSGRGIVIRAIERGELPPDTSAGLLLDALSGSIVHRLLLSPNENLTGLEEQASEFSERVVDFILTGARWNPAGVEG